MANTSGKAWAAVAAVIAFWIVLDAVFGARNVRSVLRGGVVFLLILALGVAIADKLIVAYRTSYPPSNPRVAYHAIVARAPSGAMPDGYVIGMLREGTKGYSPQPQFGAFADFAVATQKAEELNSQLGLTQGQVNRMVDRWA